MYLDSNVFINYYVSSGRQGRACATLMKRISEGEQRASISPLVVDEVLYYLINKRGLPFAQRALQAMLANPGFRVLPIGQDALSMLSGYLDSGLEPRDAMHAAVMEAHNISVICSYDKAFDRVKGIKRQAPR